MHLCTWVALLSINSLSLESQYLLIVAIRSINAVLVSQCYIHYELHLLLGFEQVCIMCACVHNFMQLSGFT